MNKWLGIALATLAPLAFAAPVGAGQAVGDEQAVAGEAEEAEPAPIARANPNDVEELVVTAPQPNVGEIPRLEYLTAIYDARRKGADLYRRGRYEEAFPHLLVAAKRGFKFAQARVGFLYQQGLGVEQDPEAAVGWLGVASKGATMPEIRNHFKDMWAKIPDSYHPRLLAVIDRYEADYGSRAHRVGCDQAKKAGTHIKHLTCRFIDEQIYTENDVLMGEITAVDVAAVGAGP